MPSKTSKAPVPQATARLGEDGPIVGAENAVVEASEETVAGKDMGTRTAAAKPEQGAGLPKSYDAEKDVAIDALGSTWGPTGRNCVVRHVVRR